MSLTVKQANDQLRKWGACSEGFDRVKGKRSIKSMIEAASLSDLVWAIEKIGGPTLAKYGRVCGAAWAEYDRVRGAASAECNRVCGAAARSILLKKYG